MAKSCKEIAQTLYDCVKKTQCMKDGNDVRKCLKAEHSEECQQFRNAYFSCKRSGLDMRTRIKGQKEF